MPAAGGIIPLVQALLEQGMAPGAALAFLLAGPATRVTALMALATILRPAFVAAYVALLIAFSVVVGVTYAMISLCNIYSVQGICLCGGAHASLRKKS